MWGGGERSLLTYEEVVCLPRLCRCKIVFRQCWREGGRENNIISTVTMDTTRTHSLGQGAIVTGEEDVLDLCSLPLCSQYKVSHLQWLERRFDTVVGIVVVWDAHSQQLVLWSRH